MDQPARAYLNMARQYHEAADVLLSASEQRPKIYNSGPFEDPIRFLYLHTMELALKAFLRFHQRPIPRISRDKHQVTVLYEQSRSLGLVLGANDRFMIGNVVRLLDSGNRRQGYRYFNPASGVTAELAWTREVVSDLIRAVSRHIEGQQRNENKPRKATKLTMVFAKPVPRR